MEYIFISILVFTFYNYTYNYSNNNIKKDLLKKDYYVNLLPYYAMFVMILFAGFRAITVGTDTINYKDNYDTLVETKNFKSGHGFESLFQLINFIPAVIFQNDAGFTIMLLLCAIIIVFSMNYLAKEISPDVALTMFLFVVLEGYLSSLNQLRQGVAVAFLMCAFIAMLKKKPVIFVLLCIIATFFHKSTIVFLPMYLLNFIKWDYLHYIILSILALIFCLFDNQIIYIICTVLNLKYYDSYVKIENSPVGLTNLIKIVGSCLLFIVLLIYYLKYYKKKNKDHKTFKLLLDIYFCSCLIYVISLCSLTIINRFVHNFYWALIVLIPMFIKSIPSKKIKNLVYIACLVTGFLYLGFSLFFRDIYGIVPYEFILNLGV